MRRHPSSKEVEVGWQLTSAQAPFAMLWREASCLSILVFASKEVRDPTVCVKRSLVVVSVVQAFVFICCFATWIEISAEITCINSLNK